ncbi:hypothetical protein EIP91_000140, partial [Steccherinum ochraceum]
MSFLLMDEETPSRSHAHTRSPSVRRSRFTFFVGRKKTVVARSTSVRRSQSHRRTPSHSVFASRRQSRRESRPPPTQNITSEPISVDRSASPTVAKRSSTLPVISISMAKDSELPPLPPEATNSQPDPQQSGKGLFKRFTNRIRSASNSNNALSQPAASSSRTPAAAAPPGDQVKRKKTMKLPAMPAPPKAHTPVMVNAFTSPELRQAALRERGLLPAVSRAYRDEHGYMVPLSQQEAEIDKRRSVVMQEPGRSSGEEDPESEAKQIREAWLRKNAEAAAPSPVPEEETVLSAPGHLQTHQHQHQQQQQEAAAARSSSQVPEPERKDSLSASERASALAATDNRIVIGTQQSPRLGTFVQPNTPVFSMIADMLTHMDGSTGNTTSTVKPHEVPLPASPTPTHRDEDGLPLPPSPSASIEKVARWLQSPTDSNVSYATAPSSPWAANFLSSPPPPGRSVGAQSVEAKTPQPLLPMIVEDDAAALGSRQAPKPPLKAKPPPIAVTAATISISTSQSAPPTSVPPSLQSPKADIDDTRSPRSATLPKLSISSPTTPTPARGRSTTVATTITATSSLAPSNSTSSRSRVPALSPSRTTSSSITNNSNSEVPPTPTGTGTGTGMGPSSFVRPRKGSVVSDESCESPTRNRHAKILPGLAEGGLKIQTESPVEEQSEYGTAEDEDEEKEEGRDEPAALPEPTPTPRLRPRPNTGRSST